MDTMLGQAAPPGLRARFSTVWAAIAAALALSTAALAAPVSTSYLLGLDSTSKLWMLQLGGTSSSAVTLFQSATLSASSNAIAYDAARGDVYAMDSDLSLYRWRDGESDFSVVATGSAIGLASPMVLATGATYYNNAYWFFVGATNELRKVSFDYTGPTPTVSGYETFTAADVTIPNRFGDIAINPLTNTLFAYTAPNSGGNFYSLDLTTASSGTIGGYNLISTTSGTGFQLAYDTSYTTLYAQNTPTGEWFTLSTVDGTLTPVPGPGGTFTTVGFDDIAGASVQPVPEPDTLALAAMGGGVLAWQVSRRRRKPNDEADDGEPGDPPDSDDLS